MIEELKSLQPLDNESPNAYQAFCDYVNIGYTRSIVKLSQMYQNDTEVTPTKRLRTLKNWSSRYEWQRRINEYQQEFALLEQMNWLESYNEHIEKALPMAETLL